MQPKSIMFFVSLALTTAMLSSTYTAQAMEKCIGEEILRSVNSNHRTVITFTNKAQSQEESFKVYWIDMNGQRVQYAHLFPGESHRQETFLGHPWVVTSPVPGGGEDCIDLYLPRFQGETIVFGSGGNDSPVAASPAGLQFPSAAKSWGGKVRSGPGMQYQQVASLNEREPVTLLENSGVMMNGYPWFKIGFRGGRTGYKWGGILCAADKPTKGLFEVCR